MATFREEEVKSEGKCRCGYDEHEKESLGKDAFRKSDNPQTIKERRVINQAFTQHDIQNGSEAFRGGQLRTQMLQRILSQATAEKAENIRKHPTNDVRHLFDTTTESRPRLVVEDTASSSITGTKPARQW